MISVEGGSFDFTVDDEASLSLTVGVRIFFTCFRRLRNSQ